MSDTMYCSFCKKSQYEVEQLIAGRKDGPVICSECVKTCAELISKRNAARNANKENGAL